MVISRGQSSEPDSWQELAGFVKVFSLIGVVILIVFGTANIISTNNVVLGYLEFMGGLVLAINFVIVKLTKNLALGRDVLLLVMAVFLTAMLLSGGLYRTGIFWFYLFPIVAFFVAGKAKGFTYIGLMYLVVFAVMALDMLGLVESPYTIFEISVMLISLFVVCFAIYVYQKVREEVAGASQQSRRELQVERTRADAIVESIGEGVVALDKENRVTFVNKAAEDLLGWWQHDLEGKRFIDVVKIQDESGNDIETSNWPLVPGSDDKYSTVLKYYKKDGQSSILMASAVPIKDDDKRVGSVATLRDITEERAIDRAKSEFMTVASHQLRTPISAISWFAEMLLNGDAGKLSKEQKQDISQIYQSNLRMARLVGDMLIVSQLELKSLPIEPEVVNLKTLLENTVKEQLAGISEERQPIIKHHFDSSVTKVKIDPGITKIILHNLINNAVKYTPKGGSISVEVVGGGAPGEKLTMIISDSGYGIPKPAQEKIFTKFFRAQNIRDKDTDGTGLGLFIVKALLDYIGGDVSFTSEENQGTIFVVHLPYGKTDEDKK